MSAPGACSSPRFPTRRARSAPANPQPNRRRTPAHHRRKWPMTPLFLSPLVALSAVLVLVVALHVALRLGMARPTWLRRWHPSFSPPLTIASLALVGMALGACSSDPLAQKVVS